MNKNIGIIFGVIVVVGVVGSIYFSKNGGVMEEKVPEVMVKDEVMMKKDTEVMEKSAPEVMVKAGSYEAYSAEKIAKAASGDVVLFFRASWCPSCKQVDADIKSNLSKIPTDLTILDVNYDSSAELKKKYGVTYQHTFVQVDKDGNLIKKWSGSPTLMSLISEVL